ITSLLAVPVHGPFPATYSVSITVTGGTPLLRQIVALIFIFICTTVAWMILGSTVMYRTQNSDEQLKARVGSTWGTPKEKSPPVSSYSQIKIVPTTTIENGKTIIHNNNKVRPYFLPLQSSRINANLNLDHRQKGLLWYSTYTINFTADYKFQNDSDKPQTVKFVLPFPSRKAVYDGLTLTVDGQRLPLATN